MSSHSNLWSADEYCASFQGHTLTNRTMRFRRSLHSQRQWCEKRNLLCAISYEYLLRLRMKFIKLDNCPIFSRNIQSHTILTPRTKNMIIKMYIVLLAVFNLNHIYPYGCILSKSVVWVGSLHNGKMNVSRVCTCYAI